MPSSGPYFLNEICDLIIKMKPKSILDVGSGYGKFGVLAREYTDIWAKRYNRNEWEVRIDAIEGWNRYVIGNKNYAVYDGISCCNALDAFPRSKYDLILCVDMLEHLKPPDGRKLLEHFREHARCSAVVVPVDPGLQGPVFSNDFEKHWAVGKAKWTKEQLERYGKVLKKSKALMLIMGDATPLKTKVKTVPKLKQRY